MTRKQPPKYAQIVAYFIQLIDENKLTEGQPLPTETDICLEFNVSHMTYSKAMNELANKGYITRVPGNGTFVSHAYRHRYSKPLITRDSISNVIRSFNQEPHTRLLSYQVLKASDNPEVAKALHLKENEFMHYFVRERFANKDIFCLSYTYVSQRILPAIDVAALTDSFNAYLKKIGIQRSDGYEEISACLPTKEMSEIFGTSKMALLKQRIIWNVGDEPFELTEHHYPSGKFILTSQLHAKQ